MKPEVIEALTQLSSERRFATGETLRLRGGFAHEMLWILEGEVDVTLARTDEEDVRLTVGRNSIVGEIGFLTGAGATADVKTLTPVRALAIDRDVLDCLEGEQPALAAELSRWLARTIEARRVHSEVLLADLPDERTKGLSVVMCTTPELLLKAQRVRYDVYCGEFGRPSNNASHEHRTIADELDERGMSFLALKAGEAVGTSRVNFTRDGGLGMLPEIYGMARSEHFPENASVITKYAIRERYRGGSTYIALFGAMATCFVQAGVKEIYIDCVPPLARFYATMGFTQCAEEFMHYENGLSVPMVLDVVDYTQRMSIEERYRKKRWR